MQIEFELKKMCREHRVDGRTTQADRIELAATVARDLDACGYHRFSRQRNCSRKLKDKHVRGLVAHWTGKGLSPGTINNRLAFLRHVCEWSGRGVMPKRNADYHDGKRVREATVSKAAYVGTEVLDRVRNRYAQASLRLQVAFGLRRKEGGREGIADPAVPVVQGLPRRPMADGLQEHRAYGHARFAACLRPGPL